MNDSNIIECLKEISENVGSIAHTLVGIAGILFVVGILIFIRTLLLLQRKDEGEIRWIM